jgi:hypothetical protein
MLITSNRQEALRRFSKGALGNRYRLEVAGAIARRTDGQVVARALAAELQIPDSLVHPELKRLQGLGLLSAPARIDRHLVYRRRKHAYWDAVQSLEAGLQRDLRTVP